MRRVMIIGSGGSGKSTLARQLHDILRLPLIHLDRLYWNPGWVPTTNERWAQIIADIISADQWIIDGNYGGTHDARIARADTIIFLDLPPHVCLWRILCRNLRYRGTHRPDMTPGCNEKADWEFIKWIWDYPAHSRPKIMQKLRQIESEKSVIICRTTQQVAKLVQRFSFRSRLTML